MADEFFRGARELLPDYGASEVKTIGDAMMIEVADPARAVELGTRIAHELGIRHGFRTITERVASPLAGSASETSSSSAAGTEHHCLSTLGFIRRGGHGAIIAPWWMK